MHLCLASQEFTAHRGADDPHSIEIIATTEIVGPVG